MIINKIAGRISEENRASYTLDYVDFEWWELSKRIQRKRTIGGRDVAMKFMAESIAMQEGDILEIDQESMVAVVVRVLPTETIVITPTSMVEMATLCYEIGNKHMPLFMEGEQILLPYEAPMFKWLESAEYNPKQEQRKLTNRLRSRSADHHHHSSHGHSHDSLISKVINFASKGTR